MTYYIYMIRNNITNQIYVGLSNDPNRRFSAHMYHSSNGQMRRSIELHGRKHFTYWVAEETEDEFLAENYEKYWIKKCKNDLGKYFVFNVERGGLKTLGKRHRPEPNNTSWFQKALEFDNLPPYEDDGEEWI